MLRLPGNAMCHMQRQKILTIKKNGNTCLRCNVFPFTDFKISCSVAYVAGRST